MSEHSTPGARDRNRARIVEAARRLWIEEPDASMDAVAQAAGVVRRTLYGHFATREDLVVAVATQAADFVDDLVVPDPDSSPTIRLAAMSNRLWSAARDMRLLVIAAEHVDATTVTDMIRRVDAAVATVIAEGQRSGEFGDHLPPEAMAKAMAGSAAALHAAVVDGSWSGNADEVALASLIVVGVPPAKARKALQHGRYRRAVNPAASSG